MRSAWILSLLVGFPAGCGVVNLIVAAQDTGTEPEPTTPIDSGTISRRARCVLGYEALRSCQIIAGKPALTQKQLDELIRLCISTPGIVRDRANCWEGLVDPSNYNKINCDAGFATCEDGR